MRKISQESEDFPATRLMIGVAGKGGQTYKIIKNLFSK